MKCFGHPESAALAVCKHCGRALCQECLTEVRGMMCCHGVREEHVAAYASAMRQFQRRTAAAVLSSGIILLLLSPACAAVGWVISLEDIKPVNAEYVALYAMLDRLTWIMYAFSGICLVGALLFLSLAWGRGQKGQAAKRS